MNGWSLLPKTDIDALILFEQRVNLVNGPVILLQLARILVPLHLTNFYPGSTQGGHSAVAGWLVMGTSWDGSHNFNLKVACYVV